MSTVQTSEQFWEDRYPTMTRQPAGVPTSYLVEYASELQPGRSPEPARSRETTFSGSLAVVRSEPVRLHGFREPCAV